MPNYFASLPAARVPENAMLDFAPVNNAFEAMRRQNNANREFDQQQQQLDAQNADRSYNRQRAVKQDARTEVEWFGKQAAAVDRLQGPQRAAAWQRIISRHPEAQSLTPDYLDPMKGPALVAAEAGQWRDPREEQLTDLDLQLKRAQIAKTDREAATTGQTDFTQREAELRRYGVDPASPEGQMYLFNKKLPSKVYDNEAQINKRISTAPKIAAGLENLRRMSETYDDQSFTNAVGPMQGSTPDSLISAFPVNVARIAGEAANIFEGGKSAPSEVRSNIQGSTEALAAAIKPLIRGPGEGVWTDADQARLVAIVGDLAQARNKDEYRRRLNAVRDRINSNFGLNVEFDALADRVGSRDGSSPLPRPQSHDEFARLPRGARFLAPDGTVRMKP